MPLAIQSKSPPKRLRVGSDTLDATICDILVEKIGITSITGQVPRTNPSITSAALCASPVIAAAAKADDNVIHGSSAVNRPSTKDCMFSLVCRLVRFETRPIHCANLFDEKTTSRFIHKNKPCTNSNNAKNQLSPMPIDGARRPTYSDAKPIIAPRLTYEINLPVLYNNDLIIACDDVMSRRLILAQTKGPHMAAQCQDNTKLNHVIDRTVATSTTSTACKRCSKCPW
jgi:hypothetical protein